MRLVPCHENDFNVFDGDRKLGRIYRVTDEPTSHWFWGLSFELIRRKSCGYALSLDEATAAFKVEYLASRTHMNAAVSTGISDGVGL
jgi:hypothetical protein